MIARKSFLLSLSITLFLSGRAEAFIPDEHTAITQAAFDSMVHCGYWTKDLAAERAKVVIRANVDQDRYNSISNVISKWFKYSHFYTPIRPLNHVGVLRGRAHSDGAIAQYRAEMIEILANTRGEALSQGALRLTGMIAHHLQDASSPLHALAINHGLSDGFEQKFGYRDFGIDRDLEQASKDCQALQNLPLFELEILLPSTATFTLKRLDQPFVYKADGADQKAPWTSTFFSNEGLIRKFVSNYLRTFNPWNPNFDYNTLGFPKDWHLTGVSEGKYGPFALAARNMGGQYFGSTQFTFADAQTAQRSNIEISTSEYTALKKDLMIHSMRTTQQLLLWLINKAQ